MRQWLIESRTGLSRGAWLLATTLAAALLFPVVNQAHGPDGKKKGSKLDRVLRKASEAGDTSTQRVIVRVRSGQAAAVVERLKKRGDRIEADHPRLEAFTAAVSGSELRTLDADPDVRSVSVDAVITANSAEPLPVTGSDVQNLLVASLGLADSNYDGDQVGVAVIDSGLELSEDLSGGRADRFFDFTTDGRAAHPYDDYGHGTHVATLIAGKGKKS